MGFVHAREMYRSIGVIVFVEFSLLADHIPETQIRSLAEMRMQRIFSSNTRTSVLT